VHYIVRWTSLAGVALALVTAVACSKQVPYSHLSATSSPIVGAPQATGHKCWTLPLHLEADYPVSDINELHFHLSLDRAQSKIFVVGTYGPRSQPCP